MKSSLDHHGDVHEVVYLLSELLNAIFLTLKNMDSELLQSFVAAGQDQAEHEPVENSRLYRQASFKDDKSKKKEVRISTTPQPEVSASGWSSRKKDRVVIEQRKPRFNSLALDECYCDKDRAASVSFGYLDIKHELKQKRTSERSDVRIMPDDDSMAFYIFGLREIKARHLESAVYFISKVSREFH